MGTSLQGLPFTQQTSGYNTLLFPQVDATKKHPPNPKGVGGCCLQNLVGCCAVHCQHITLLLDVILPPRSAEKERLNLLNFSSPRFNTRKHSLLLGTREEVNTNTNDMIKSFVCLMYGKRRFTSINKVRTQIFLEKYRPKKEEDRISCVKKFGRWQLITSLFESHR